MKGSSKDQVVSLCLETTKASHITTKSVLLLRPPLGTCIFELSKTSVEWRHCVFYVQVQLKSKANNYLYSWTNFLKLSIDWQSTAF